MRKLKTWLCAGIILYSQIAVAEKEFEEKHSVIPIGTSRPIVDISATLPPSEVEAIQKKWDRLLSDRVDIPYTVQPTQARQQVADEMNEEMYNDISEATLINMMNNPEIMSKIKNMDLNEEMYQDTGATRLCTVSTKNGSKFETFIETKHLLNTDYSLSIMCTRENNHLDSCTFRSSLPEVWEVSYDITTIKELKKQKYISPIIQITQEFDYYISKSIEDKYFSLGLCKNGRWDVGFASSLYPNGNVKCSVEYVNGKRHGSAVCYSMNGDVLLHITYQNGKPESGYCIGSLYADTKRYLNNIQLDNFSRTGYNPCGSLNYYKIEETVFDYTDNMCSLSLKEIAKQLLSWRNINVDDFKILNNDFEGWEQYNIEQYR